MGTRGVRLAAVLIASLIDRGRAAVRKGMRRLAEATSDWEGARLALALPS